MSSHPVHVVARVHCLPDHVEATRTLLMGLVQPTRNEPGCIRYELLQNTSDPTEFTFVEIWESADALEQHFGTPHMQAAIAQIPNVVAQEPDIQRYQQLA